jgi:phage terminase small subunit
MDNVIEFSHTENKILSDKEKKFVHGIISGLGKRQAALEAGYAETSAHVQASRLLKKDKITRAVSRARSLQMQQTVHTLDKEINKLDRLYEAACTKKQLGAAVQAARLKAQLLGYLVEKKEVKHSQFDTMSEDDLIEYLDKLKANYGG